MHIFHIITSLYPGGAQSALCRLCMRDTNNKHTVVAMIGGGALEARLIEQGIVVEALDFTRRGGLLKGFLALWRLLRSYRPDVVQTWMYHPDLIGGVCARLAGVRHVCWGIRHTTLEPGKSSRSSILTARLCASLSGLVPCRIVCCAHEAARVHESLGYRSEKLIVIPNGYDLSDFYPYMENRGARQIFLSDSELHLPILGMVGRFNAQKDHENLLRALVDLKARGVDFRCLLVGADLDADNETLVRWIEKFDLQHEVKLLGLRSDIPTVMNALDLHVLSSSFGEAFPNVIAEAMACGTPCVGTDVGDTSMIIGKWGWVVPPRDSKKLADAIHQAIKERETSPSLWAQRRRSSAEHIRTHFTIDRMVAAFDDLWSNCMEARE
ncbi:glycosyltransferase [Billgrantia bachuensis]|uniref:Glycosyltransferase n=1 Tax=Billgrantia bachuensis TaxID=2717286 RepID=A0ABX0PMA4_9GAMM|nr:glycosyltransferase [Halomonas bachuensis]NIC04400.1 glycosyltransferase [Halomonas bachuensis]